MAKTEKKTARFDAEATVARLRAVVEAFESMDGENERRATMYYVVARLYGNDVGAVVLDALPRE